MSITIRPGPVKAETWDGLRFASPMPEDATPSKSPERTTFITFGSANARRPGAVGPFS